MSLSFSISISVSISISLSVYLSVCPSVCLSTINISNLSALNSTRKNPAPHVALRCAWHTPASTALLTWEFSHGPHQVFETLLRSSWTHFGRCKFGRLLLGLGRDINEEMLGVQQEHQTLNHSTNRGQTTEGTWIWNWFFFHLDVS